MLWLSAVDCFGITSLLFWMLPKIRFILNWCWQWYDIGWNPTRQSAWLLIPDIKPHRGVLINVLPSINLDVVLFMQLRPTITKINDYGLDPGSGVCRNNRIVSIFNFIPKLSMFKRLTCSDMKSGQMMVMGGLLQDTSSSTQEGVSNCERDPSFRRIVPG